MKELTNTNPLQNMMREDLPAVKAKNTMGKDDFMLLLLTQLKHQDPLKPMDHQEFATQLAQFSSLEQLSNIGTGIQGVKSTIGEESKLAALGMIGKRVHSGSNEFQLVEGQTATLASSLRSDLRPNLAVVYNAEGKPIRELKLSGKEKEILWDGKGDDGRTVPSGKYSFRVHGVDAEGKSREIGTELSGRVLGVEMDGQNAVLVVETPGGQSKVNLAKVRQVYLDDPKPKVAVAPDPKLLEKIQLPLPNQQDESSKEDE